MRSSYHVPAEPFRRLVLEAIEGSVDNEGRSDLIGATRRVAIRIWQDTETLSEAESVAYRERLRGFLRNGAETIKFDLADRIVTRINVGRWYSDPELNEIYRNVNLRDLDIVKPTNDWIIPDLLKQIEDMGAKDAGELFGLGRDTVRRVLAEQAA